MEIWIMPVSLSSLYAPTAATVAAAVAAPSAATIATSVAGAVPTRAQIQTDITSLGNAYNGPSAATIASTVAAPSSATIASAVAAAVPTLAQINTSVATNAPSPNGWVHLGTASLANVASATVSFSAYRKLRVIWKAQGNSTGGSTTVQFRLNGDTANYYFGNMARSYTNQTSSFYNANNFSICPPGNLASAGLTFGFVDIDFANQTSNQKMVQSTWVGNSGAVGQVFGDALGIYAGTSAITSVTILAFSSNFSNTPNTDFSVYGVN
jgi:hypothetical protein